MKKHVLVIAVIMAFLAVMSLTSCKRASVDDPNKDGPTGHSITLSGSANPVTLYISQGKPDAYSLLTVSATQHDGNPATGREIILESGAYGFLQDTKISVKLNTGGSGVVNSLYRIPQGTDVRISTTIYIKATLIDEQKPADASIYCYVPIQVIPYTPNDYIRVSGTIIDQYSNRGVGNVVIELSTGGATKTGGSGGYSFNIYGGASLGWYGDITPTKENVKFIPAKISLGSEDAPIFHDVTGVNFYAVVKQTIVVTPTEMSFNNAASGAVSAYVYCTPDANFRATFIASSSATWLELGTSSGDVNYSSVTTTTPTNIYLRVGANGTGIERTATVTITVISPENASGTVTINVYQEA
jgi:hypothetical protein